MPLAAHLMLLPEFLVSYRTLAFEQARDNQSLRAVDKQWHRSWNSALAPAPHTNQRAGKRRCLAETMAAREPR